MARTLFALCFAALVTVPGTTPPAFGRDSFGHMMVAAVAELTSPAKAHATALVRMNPKYSEWAGWVPATASPTEKDMMVFMIAATWPDQIKQDHSYTSDGSHHGNRPEGSPDPSANRG